MLSRVCGRLKPVGDIVGSARRANQTQIAQLSYKDESKKEGKGYGKYWAGATLGIVATGLFVGAGSNWSGIEDEFDHLPLIEAMPKRAKSGFTEMIEYFAEPSDDTLLPPLLPAPYQPPYTLVIELNELLTSKEHSLGGGWKYKKRQGVDVFLTALAQHYEIVIFTRSPGTDAMPIIEAIDPHQCVLYKLFRDSTKYQSEGLIKGVYLKDLSKLNRDLKTVVLIDTKREAVSLQPENCMVLPKWGGDDDLELIDLADMLVVIAQERPADIRELIKCYTELEDPVGAYRMRRAQILEAEQKEQLEAQLKAQKSKGGFLAKFKRG